jgi:hypothetical protein
LVMAACDGSLVKYIIVEDQAVNSTSMLQQ